MLTFQEAADQINREQPSSILLGNGFSRAWNDEIFNYRSLFDAADFGERSYEIKSVFDTLRTENFEQVMGSLIASALTLEIYASCLRDKISEIRGDAEGLREALIAAIAHTHPDVPYRVTPNAYRSTRSFLGKYQRIYTVNYDLLLYWARNQTDLDDGGNLGDDGFRRGSWVGYGSAQNIFFLHGGLHIYEHPEGIKKHAYESGTTIVEKVRDNLNQGIFPLFVSEPTSERKRERITRSPYLFHALNSLESATGSFYILGHSMDLNDAHIFDVIRKSAVTKIFVSLHGNENSEENRRTKANALTYLDGNRREIQFFDASTVSIWRG